MGLWPTALLKSVDLPAQIAVAITFTLLFLTTMAFFLVLGFLLSRFVKLLFLGGFNRLVGGVFGLSQGVLLLAVVVFALSSAASALGVGQSMKEAYLAPPFVDLGNAVTGGEPACSEMIPEKVAAKDKSMADSLVQLEFAKVVKLVVAKPRRSMDVPGGGPSPFQRTAED